MGKIIATTSKGDSKNKCIAKFGINNDNHI